MASEEKAENMQFTPYEISKAVCTDVFKKIQDVFYKQRLVICRKIGGRDLPVSGQSKYFILVGYYEYETQSIIFPHDEKYDVIAEGYKPSLYGTVYLTLIGDKIKLVLGDPLADYTTTKPNNEIFNILQIRIKSAKLSGKVFGKTEDKSELIDTVFSPKQYQIGYGKSKKLQKETYFAEILLGEKTLKFVISDLEFVLPSLKGYSIPKDKTIRENSKVIIKRDPDKQIWRVRNIIKDRTSKRISMNCQNRRNDIVTIFNPSVGVTKKVFAKHLKLI